ncbi:MAG: cell division protein ZapA [Clostridiales bacterium]|nr:cell division protein ZapA [Clostridiales bacterium]
MSAKNSTQVIIAGKIYTLSGYESEEYLQRVAAYLNGKISELRNLDGYQRLSPDMKSILLNLNAADDYFKMKNKVDELEQILSEKDRDIYELRHEIINSQIRLENAQKQIQTLEDRSAELQKEIIQLETQLKTSHRP